MSFDLSLRGNEDTPRSVENIQNRGEGSESFLLSTYTKDKVLQSRDEMNCTLSNEEQDPDSFENHMYPWNAQSRKHANSAAESTTDRP